MSSLSAAQLLDTLKDLAPLDAAAEWDNTGLLISPPPRRPVQKILLTLDLTPAVAKEALQTKTDWVIAYHPPIFSGLKTLNRDNPLTAALLNLVTAGVAVYSPHTALDAAADGLSDWLASAFANAEIEPVEGSGRKLNFRKAQSAEQVAAQIQSHIQAPYLRICTPQRKRKIKSLGLCPGAGASVLSEMSGLDAVFTGEMRHHDMLAWQSAGVHVFLSEHGHTERPYLRVFQQRLKAALPKGVQIRCSRKDREPVSLVLPDA